MGELALQGGQISAQASDNVSFVGLYTYDATTQDFDIYGEPIYQDNTAKAQLGVSYDASTNTVTLSNCNRSDLNLYIEGTGTVNVQVVGTNSLLLIDTWGVGLNFTGTGVLTVNAGKTRPFAIDIDACEEALGLHVGSALTLNLFAGTVSEGKGVGCVLVRDTTLVQSKAIRFDGLVGSYSVAVVDHEPSYTYAVDYEDCILYDSRQELILDEYYWDEEYYGVDEDGYIYYVNLDSNINKILADWAYDIDEDTFFDEAESTGDTISAYELVFTEGVGLFKDGQKYIGCRYTVNGDDGDEEEVINWDVYGNLRTYQVSGSYFDDEEGELSTYEYDCVYGELIDEYLPGDEDAPDGYSLETKVMPEEWTFAVTSASSSQNSSQNSSQSKSQSRRGLATGATAVVGGATYKVTNDAAGTVIFQKAPKNQKSVTIPATVTLNGKAYSVVGIAAKAFSGAKAKKVTIKTTRLTKNSVKKCFKGAKKLKTVKVPKAKKKAYKKIFKKKNCGIKVKVK